MNNIEQVAQILKKSKKLAVCGHSMPDGDSLGSTLSMGLLLKSLGKEVTMVSPDPVPKAYSFLPSLDEIKSPEEFPTDIDAAVLVDCTDVSRTGDKVSSNLSNIPVIINIDHHISNQVYGSYNYVDDTAAATGEIIYQIARSLNIQINKEIATCIYTAIVMDTGSFKYENTTEKTHRIVAELLSSGINVSKISTNLFENKELTALQLIGKALSSLKLSDNGKVAWISLPYTLMKEVGAKDEHAEGIVNYPRMVEGCLVGLLFREIVPNKVKVGFRSKDIVDVNKIAGRFGGGGHPRAAGCQLEMSLKEVEEKVISEVLMYLKELED